MYKIMHIDITITKAVGKSDILVKNIKAGYFICYKFTTSTTYRTTITVMKSLSRPQPQYVELIKECMGRI